MGKIVVLLFVFSLQFIFAAEKPLPYRWFYLSCNLTKKTDLREIKDIFKTAAEHGYNGFIFSAGFDAISLQKEDYFQRLEELKNAALENKLELIPIFMSAGWGGAIVHDKELAEGTPVKDALFVVKGNAAYFEPEGPAQIFNGSFEEEENGGLKGFKIEDISSSCKYEDWARDMRCLKLTEKQGLSENIDKTHFKTGNTSVKIGGSQRKKGTGEILTAEVKVKPFRDYELSCWIRSEKLGNASLRILGKNGETLGFWRDEGKLREEWQKKHAVFNSRDNETVKVCAGVWKFYSNSGTTWFDGAGIEEVNSLDGLLRRAGTPACVRNESTGKIYTGGRDYEFHGEKIDILAGGEIKNGDRLRAGYYRPVHIGGDQTSLCMSEPKLYEIWQKQAEYIHKYLKPRKYFLSMDEIRAGGSCEACKKRNLTMAQILGACITRQYNIIKNLEPAAEVFIWSDMLDPNHNACNNYWFVEGDLTGSWNYIPGDIVVACWNYEKRDASLKHFSALGFKTIGAAYYDANDLKSSGEWLKSLARAENTCGLVYTTWKNKYKLLADFGDMLNAGR